MTEAEWLTSSDSYPRQLLVIEKYATVRKLRLIAATYVRVVQSRTHPDWEEDKQCDDIIEAVAADPNLWIFLEPELWSRPGSWRLTHILPRHELDFVVKELRKLFAFNAVEPEHFAAGLIHEVVGNPFRPVTFDPAWRTSTVVALAQGMYESRDFSAMPILADALQDAGCDNDDILNHCRAEKQVHVRGCWVVDLALGKS